MRRWGCLFSLRNRRFGTQNAVNVPDVACVTSVQYDRGGSRRAAKSSTVESSRLQTPARVGRTPRAHAYTDDPGASADSGPSHHQPAGWIRLGGRRVRLPFGLLDRSYFWAHSE